MIWHPFVFSSALKDALRPQRIAVWCGVALVVFGLGRVWRHVAEGTPAIQLYSQFSAILLFKFLALASAVFSATVVSQELEQKTIVYSLTRAVPRSAILFSRSAAAMIASALVSLLCWGSAVLSILGPSGLGRPGPQMDAVLIVLGAAAYGAFFVAISLVVNRSMIWSLLFAFGWETFVPNMPGALYFLSIDSYLKALSKNPSPDPAAPGVLQVLSGKFAEKGIPAYVPWMVLIGLTVGLTALAMLLCSRFEYVPREDSE